MKPRELLKRRNSEVPRIYLLRGWVNKGKKKGREEPGPSTYSWCLGGYGVASWTVSGYPNQSVRAERRPQVVCTGYMYLLSAFARSTRALRALTLSGMVLFGPPLSLTKSKA